ncbi:MAG TPA: hypothetical protein PLF27_07865 [Sedimentibacter sp.]|nr:hypothetical protein [Sedimentibacter sp.]
MKEYLSYYSAALFWNIPFIETVLDSIIDNTSKVNYTVTNKSERFLKKDKIRENLLRQ